MSSPNPRRCPQKGTPSPSCSEVTPSRVRVTPLVKSETFHVPLALSTDLVDAARFMPQRSPTCPKTLERLVEESSHASVRDILNDFDRTFYRRRSPARPSRASTPASDPTVVPPSNDRMDIDQKENIIEDHRHDSDSGIGSSVSSAGDAPDSPRTSPASITTLGSSITRSFTTSLKSIPSTHLLSSPSRQHIDRLILQPIKAEAALREFHPLIDDIPRRIDRGEISNLRDLEKILILLAPSIAASPKNYLRFCEQSIRVLISTVEYLPPRDLQLPSDRPYSNGYFLDLVAQVRNYAHIMARTREREAAGQPLADDDYHPGEKLSLRGGLSENGTTMELVRNRKDGVTIPIASEDQLHPVHSKSSPSKRVVVDESDDESVYRSMARRKKNEPPPNTIYPCPNCSKEFKRPCDLTKHEKTHSRPFKCKVKTCKYHQYGWPTEKECERHYNDKHAANPHLFRCAVAGCTYTSKRESNCKQHMEKAHNVPYIRSKSNGKKRASDVPGSAGSGSLASATPQTPLTPFITPASNQAFPHLATPGASPFMSGIDPFRHGSAATTDASHSPAPFNPDFDFRAAWGFPQEPTANTTPFVDDAITPDTPDFDVTAYDISFESANNMGHGFHPLPTTAEPAHQAAGASLHPPTPPYSGPNTHQTLMGSPFLELNVFDAPAPPATETSPLGQMTPATHISSVGQGHLTLLSPDDMVDEGFGDEFLPSAGEDFLLFDEPASDAFRDMPGMSRNAPQLAPTNAAPITTDFDYMTGMGFSQQNPTDDMFADLGQDPSSADWMNGNF